ncbi:MAG: hypothetical protein A3C08_01160 [Candidatus Taylorbacteria bacterium RIFCSPHIGHO2_02_FULL_47_18]|uniref:Carbohydrate kinase PfkB domain-containing protein n=1 Tax=Candidatus Taylorbacteria bacterium RIFCSPLOWO2_01_FULL_48_100 TaxID=1802322 RepID=A0A1G2NI94_9BACT|nr:MAG: hypothetical protein A2670_00270 [Candidatus Taylorbacteria bacterium RIFCSPHIGHO2_01_FULL_48_38]OHA28294.1 MAG: hypothetical protein A3C08_01160 [Candidatus Taylorbacteria bacterium RIFCSPHIGHO2_02_FULL_47_18]OHA35052.1 MAG: hypothetical protein A2938_00585 [Candidatus Taylorbacteria bacterium RIFCSPLOWO2_01_FULL_48_100]OHA40621.1 MAG: hypothetical protein A3J31_02345 [Candidatus Taylorbacteria bacterium RIFCSPLOWO2_02_FULL_48_16]OHA44851.1 MAG: hypothetical protein A3H13_00670 [Candid
MQYDFLAIGDTTVDAFIKISDAWIETDNPKREQELCMRFAEKVPYESLTEIPAVGNSANAAVCAARLGLAAGLVSNIGADDNGKKCLDTLKKENLGVEYIKAHTGAKTNYHFVLWYGAERTILVKHELYPYALPNIEPPRWLYLSSIGGGTEKYHEEIAAWLAKNPSVKFASQPGTFQISLGTKKLRALYERADVFVCNREEAQKITSSVSLRETPPSREEFTDSLLEEGAERSEAGDVKNLLNSLRALGPKIVCITDGPNGAYMADSSGEYFMSIYPDPKPPYERTGAGDAFASTFVSYLALGKTPFEALRLAPINSAYVVQGIGAQRGLLSREKLEEYLKNAPREYEPRRL